MRQLIPRRWYKPNKLKIILLLAFALRMALFARALFLPEVMYDGDSREYWALAENLIQAKTFDAPTDRPFPPGSVRTPVYPAFLSMWIFWGGNSPWLPVLLQVLLSTLNVWLVYRLAIQIGAAKSVAHLAALILALDMSSIIYAVTLMSETLFTTLLLITWFSLHDLLRHPGWSNIMTLAILTTFLVLTRPIAQYFPIILFFIVGSQIQGRILQRWGKAVIYLFLVSLFLAPWIWRNSRRYDYAGISTIQAYNLLYYNGALALAKDKGLSLDEAEDQLTAVLQQSVDMTHASIGQIASAMQKLGVQTILSHAPTYIRLHAQGMAALLLDPGRINLSRAVYGRQTSPGLLETLSAKGILSGMGIILQEKPVLVIFFFLGFLWQIAALFFLMIGGWQARHLLEKNDFWNLILFFGYFWLVTGLIGAARFRVPGQPFLSVFISFGFITYCYYIVSSIGKKFNRDFKK